MTRISASKFAKALARQRALSDQQWLQRCDELFQQQKMLFLELVTFGRDGASEAQFRSLIDYLSCLQFLAVDEPDNVSSPIETPEFYAAIGRASRFFQSMSLDARMFRVWQKEVVSRGEPVVWAACIDTLQQHDIMSSPLSQAVVVTLHAIADVYSRRFAEKADTEK